MISIISPEGGQLAPRSNYIEKNVHFSFASPLLAKVVTSETLVPNRQAFPPQRNVSNCLNSQFAWNRLLGKPRLKQYLPSRPHYHFSRSWASVKTGSSKLQFEKEKLKYRRIVQDWETFLEYEKPRRVLEQCSHYILSYPNANISITDQYHEERLLLDCGIKADSALESSAKNIAQSSKNTAFAFVVTRPSNLGNLHRKPAQATSGRVQ